MTSVLGLHHVTAIASDPQRNLDFYTGVLGLRLVKLTVNYDDPGTYHFYFADADGTPGSIMTFFPWPRGRAGRHGAGQVAVTAFSIAPASVGVWIQRFISRNIRYEGPTKRGTGANSETVIGFRDPDGARLELVAHPAAESRAGAPWESDGITRGDAIRGFHAVTLWVEKADDTERVIADLLGFRAAGEAESTRRYVAGAGGPGAIVDVREVGGFPRGSDGVGAVHHVAFAVQDDETEVALRERVIAAGHHATPVVDRTYFHSVYFREPGGVLFELATLAPGFTVDEPREALGTSLKLPDRLEGSRRELVSALPEINTA